MLMKSELSHSRRLTLELLVAVIALAMPTASALLAQALEYDTTLLKPYPWTPTMPRDYTQDKLTAADWVGPDGIIYPNWTWAGVHIGTPGQRKAGIPDVQNIFTTIDEKLAGSANGEAFTDALVKAIDACGEAGGGVIKIPVGTYVLTRPIMIRHSKVVIRGAGRGKSAEEGGRNDLKETRVQFDFAYGVGDAPVAKVLTFPHHGRITRDSQICFYAQAFHEKSSHEARQGGGKTSHIHGFYITITPDNGKPIRFGYAQDYNERHQYDKFLHFRPAGPSNVVNIPAERLFGELKDAKNATFEVKVVWKWKEKQGKEQVQMEESATSPPVTLSTEGFLEELPAGKKNMIGGSNWTAISFVGDGETYNQSKVWFLDDARRGDTEIRVNLADAADAEKRGYKPGAMVGMMSYSSRPWVEAIERDGETGVPRDQQATVKSLRPADNGGMIVEIEQPLQFDFPKNEGQVDQWDPKINGYAQTGEHSSWMQVVLPIEECGVEDLVLEQTQHIWFSGINFSHAMNCWMKNVRIERPGRDLASLGGIMNEMRDCEFIDPRWSNNTGGGSGYLHGSSFGLIDNVYVRNARHAPNFTGHTAGVVRNSRFFSSDMQWHQNWGRAHLFENCTVDALKGTGSYGWAAFAQRSITEIHGPGMGPRNAIYNCDLIGPDGGIMLGGKSENPLILHNRVRARTGPGIVLRYHVFNGIILGNVFAVENRFEPGVVFGDPEKDHNRLNKTKQRPKPLVHPGIAAANVGNDFINNTIYGGSGEIASAPWFFDIPTPAFRRNYGNVVRAWDPNPPRPQPAMASVFEMQRAHPEGFAHLKPDQVLYNPDPQHAGPPNQVQRDDGTPVAMINFRDKRGDRGDQAEHWRGQEPSKGWHADLGEPFGTRTSGQASTLNYGWTNGTPSVFQEAIWADPDFRYRTLARWGRWQADDLRPFGQWSEHNLLAWQIELEPGTYNVFLAAGSPRKPERFAWPDEKPLPFTQVNDFLLNDVLVKDPGQSDVRRDAFWTTVKVGQDRRLTLKPAPTAITPAVTFIQIYRHD